MNTRRIKNLRERREFNPWPTYCSTERLRAFLVSQQLKRMRMSSPACWQDATQLDTPQVTANRFCSICLNFREICSCGRAWATFPFFLQRCSDLSLHWPLAQIIKWSMLARWHSREKSQNSKLAARPVVASDAENWLGSTRPTGLEDNTAQ